jgi:hypothetical protein
LTTRHTDADGTEDKRSNEQNATELHDLDFPKRGEGPKRAAV